MLAIRRTFYFAYRRVMRRFNYNSTIRIISLTFVGFIAGFSLTMCLQTLNSLPSTADGCFNVLTRRKLTATTYQENSGNNERNLPPPPLVNSVLNNGVNKSGFMFIGVMTAKKYLDTRAAVINQTWGQFTSPPGQLAFFVGDNVPEDTYTDMPLVRLPNVDDTYPPQKKSFLMLKYMYDNYLDQFEWFVRADDDVYLRMDKLEVFLRSLNSSRPLYLGQAGLGTPEEYGMLSLGDDENYCMGGPSIVMSRETVRLVGPHVRECLKTLYTNHEDVELGRCVKRFAGVSCTWSYEMQSMFYNNQSGRQAYAADLNVAEVHHAITLHPLKQQVPMRKLHNFVRRLKVGDLRFRSIQLNRDVLMSVRELEALGYRHQSLTQERRDVEDLFMQPSLMKFVPKTRDQILTWDYLTPTILFCTGSVSCPRHNSESYLRYALSDIVRQTMDSMNKYARQRGRVLIFQDILYGYRRVDPLHNAEYVLDILLTYKKFKGRRVSIPVRRHAYLQQSFAQLQLVDEYDYWRFDSMGNGWRFDDDERYFHQQSTTTNVTTITSRTDINSLTINFILPLSGRPTTFRRFLTHYERVCLDTSTHLTVVLFTNSTTQKADDEEILTLLNDFRRRYTSKFVRWIVIDDAPFSRGLGLSRGAAVHTDRTLLFFTDVDMIFTKNLLYRIRTNTVRGCQIFFPIVYSQYDPKYATNNSSTYEARSGYFRHFGFGLVSLYKSDFDSVHGFDLTLKGWGMEDVDLFDKFVKTTNLTLFRAPEPDLVHVYHPAECAQTLSKIQYEMCVGSKGASLTSIYSMYDLIVGNNNLWNELNNQTSLPTAAATTTQQSFVNGA